MTREEAISVLYGIKADNLNLDDAYTKDKYGALETAIKALELVEYIEQRYEEECNERRKHYADGRYHSLSMSDGASYVLGQVLDKWKESVEDKE